MLKIKRNKKLMIPVLAIMVLVAMAGNALAFAASCDMYIGDVGWISTPTVSSYKYGSAWGYNFPESSEYMGVKGQFEYGGVWTPYDTATLDPGDSYAGSYAYAVQAVGWRTKIYSATGNVRGWGYVYAKN